MTDQPRGDGRAAPADKTSAGDDASSEGAPPPLEEHLRGGRPPDGSAPSEAILPEDRLSDDERPFRKRVRQIAGARDRSAGDRIRALLRAGLARFGLESALLSRTDLAEGRHQTVLVAGSPPNLGEGTETALSKTYCRAVVTASGAFELQDAEAEGWADTEPHRAHGFSCYFGTKVVADGELYGTVCFGSRSPRKEPFRDEEEAALGLIAQAVEHLLEQSIQEEETRRLRVKYESLLEGVPDAVLAASAETGSVVEANREAASLFEMSSSEIEGTAASALVPPDERPQCRALFDRVAESDEKVSASTYEDGSQIRVETASGQQVPVEVSATSARLWGERHIVVTFRDISDRRRRERQLRLREAALQQAGESVLITAAENLDPPGPEITYVNQAFEELTGYAEDEVLGKTPRILQGPDTDRTVLARLREALEAGEEHEGETVNYRKNGEPYRVRWRVVPVVGADGSISRWVAVQRDVTEARQREAALRETRDEAEEAARLKSAVLANMSHEIRTPLTSIIGFAEAIGESSEAAGRFAPLIEKSGKRLLETLDGVLTLSKLEAGQMEFDEEKVSLRVEAETLAEELLPQAEAAGIDCRVEANGRPACAQADKGGVQIALRNLVSNAIKYTEEGEVVVRAYRDDDAAVLEVEDTGIGMDASVAESLFEPFRQASEGLSREYEGTGVGLAVTKEAVDQMGGTIEVKTQEEEGSRFIVRLPQAEGSTSEDPSS